MNSPPLDVAAAGILLREALQSTTTHEATERVKEAVTKPEHIVHFVVQMAQNPESDVRQLAAVLLRRNLYKTWSGLSSQQQKEIKETLLRRLVEDPSHVARLSIAHVISSLSKLVLPEWKTELFGFLNQCANSDNESHREIAQVVSSSVIDCMSDCVRPQLDDFAQLFLKGLQDPTSGTVRVAAMKGVSALAAAAEEPADYQRLRQLLWLLVAVTRDACISGNGDVVMFALELFGDLADNGDVLKNSDLPDMIRFMLFLSGDVNLPAGVKEQAFSFIHSINKHKPKIIMKNGLLDEILQVAVPMGLKPDPDDLDEDELTPHRMASQCIDSLALNLPSTAVFQRVVHFIGPFITSTNPWERRGALVFLGIMSEGCEDVMRHKLDELMPCVLSAFDAPHPQVKAAAAICLGQMAQYLQPEIAGTHKESLSVLLKTMHDSSIDESVREKLCYAVELFCDNLEMAEIEEHLPVLMPALLLELSTTKSVTVKENCVGAIGSVAQAAKERFADYAERMFCILEEALTQTSEAMVPLRARATTCAGSMIQALPPNICLEQRNRLVKLVFLGLEDIDHYDLREASYRFLGCLSFTLKDEFAQLLAKTVPFVVATLLNSDGIVPQYEDETENDPLEGVDSDEDSEDDRRIKAFHVRTGFLDEQEAALDLLSCMFRNISGNYMAPWLKKSLECAESLHKYFHTGVRQNVPSLLQTILVNVHYTFLPPWSPTVALSSQNNRENKLVSTSDNRGWLPGLPVKSPLHGHTVQLWVEKIWPLFCAMLLEDDDKEVLGDTCRAVGELLELMGPHLLEGSTVGGHDVQSTLMNVSMQVFSGDHACQKFEDENEIDDDEESRAVEEYLFEGVSCLISGLAQTLSEQFQTAFSKLNVNMLRLAAHKKSSAYRCIGIGCYADVFRTMGAAAAPFVEPVLAPALAGVKQTEDVSLQRNSAYCLGSISEFCFAIPQVQSQLHTFLKALHPLATASPLNMRSDELCGRDNAIAAIGRIIRSAPTGQLPLDEVVPVFINALPLKSDFEESEGILKTLVFLYMGGCEEGLLAKYQGQFLKGLAGELVNGSLTEATKAQATSLLLSGVQALGVTDPAITAIADSSPRCKDLLSKLLN